MLTALKSQTGLNLKRLTCKDLSKLTINNACDGDMVQMKLSFSESLTNMQAFRTLFQIDRAKFFENWQLQGGLKQLNLEQDAGHIVRALTKGMRMTKESEMDNKK